MSVVLVGLALGLAPVAATSLLVRVFRGRSRRPGSRPGRGAAQLASFLLLFPLVLWAHGRAGPPAGELLAGDGGGASAAALSLAVALAAGLGVIALVLYRGRDALRRWAYRRAGRTLPVLPRLSGTEAAAPLPLALAIAATAAAYEELVWRGYLQAGLHAAAGPVVAVAITSAVFAVVHLRQGRLGAAFALLSAVVLGSAFAAGGALAPVLLAHVLYNTGAVAVGRRRRAGWAAPAASAGTAAVAS